MKIYYFWQSAFGSDMPGYLKLCIDTWRQNIPGAEVIPINHDNLEEYSGGRVEVNRLKVFSLPLQSDVAAVAVLLERPGLFLDVDTIILPEFSVKHFPSDRLTMFGDPKNLLHSATNFFYSPCPRNPLLQQWLDEANDRIQYQTQTVKRIKWWLRSVIRRKPARVRWDYLGNSILDRLLVSHNFDDSIDLRDCMQRGYNQTKLYAEYVDFWLHSNIPESEVVSVAVDRVIGLQNSWMPAWYSTLETREVLTDSLLVSRVIQIALGHRS